MRGISVKRCRADDFGFGESSAKIRRYQEEDVPQIDDPGHKSEVAQRRRSPEKVRNAATGDDQHEGGKPVVRKCYPANRPEQRSREIETPRDRKSTRLNSSHLGISYAVFC